MSFVSVQSLLHIFCHNCTRLAIFCHNCTRLAIFCHNCTRLAIFCHNCTRLAIFCHNCTRLAIFCHNCTRLAIFCHNCTRLVIFCHNCTRLAIFCHNCTKLVNPRSYCHTSSISHKWISLTKGCLATSRNTPPSPPPITSTLSGFSCENSGQVGDHLLVHKFIFLGTLDDPVQDQYTAKRRAERDRN